jgi:hypothetical protein
MDVDFRATPICVLYDADSGEIRRMHQAVSWSDGDLPSEEELVEEARVIEERSSQGDTARLGVLLVREREVQSGVYYAVDPGEQRLVERGRLDEIAAR